MPDVKTINVFAVWEHTDQEKLVNYSVGGNGFDVVTMPVVTVESASVTAGLKETASFVKNSVPVLSQVTIGTTCMTVTF